jgi:hypothetical protein
VGGFQRVQCDIVIKEVGEPQPAPPTPPCPCW